MPMSWVELWDRAVRCQKCDAKQGDVADAFSALRVEPLVRLVPRCRLLASKAQPSLWPRVPLPRQYVRSASNSDGIDAAPRNAAMCHVWTGAPGDRRKVDGVSPSR
jgi:hypothetical protein